MHQSVDGPGALGHTRVQFNARRIHLSSTTLGAPAPRSSRSTSRSTLANLLLAAELPRVGLESLSLSASWLGLACRAKRGDGHPVLVMPGFGASDTSTALLRKHLNFLGYRALPWTLGTNTGRMDLQDQLMQRFLAVSDEYGQPVSLVGQSLGGVFARELARRFPDRVRIVVSLGSPFAMGRSGGSPTVVRHLFRYLSGSTLNEAQQARSQLAAREVPPVPCTSIYSRTDGVVAWRNCLEQPGQQTENIEVYSSHIGMAVHPSVWYAVTDRLQYQAKDWQPFAKDHQHLSLVYPKPAVAGS